LRNQKESMIL